MEVDRGVRLAEARKRAGLQQQEVASRLGVARGTVRRWERGYWVDIATLDKLAEMYGTSVAALRGGDPPAPVAVQRPEWPLWARERWAEVQLELVRDGMDDEALTVLRTFVLSPHLLTRPLTEAQLRQDVEAGIVAARAWVAARRQQGRP